MMHRVGLLAAVLVGWTLFGAGAASQELKKPKNIDAIFRKLDTNQDGRLSKDEFLKIADRFRDKEKARGQLAVTYEMLDPDHAGISRDQFRAFVETSVRKKEEEAKRKGAP